MSLRDKIGKELLIFDGAMGTLLQKMGLPPGYLPEKWNLEHPEVIRNIHRSYIDAGCNILTSNTFGANDLKFGSCPTDIIEAGISLAKEAIATSKSGKGYVALNLSTTGTLLAPLGPLTFDQAYDTFSQMVKAGTSADGILIETMTDTYELKAAVLAAKENSDLPIFATVMVDQKGKLLTGGDIGSVVALLEGLRVDVIGINCGFGPSQMAPFVEEMSQLSSLPIMVNPNAGLPTVVDGETVFSLTPEDFAKEMKLITKSNPWVLGGCCGTTPDHIKALVDMCKTYTPRPVEEKEISLVSSYSHAVCLNGPTLIGEKINPTGNKPMSKAIKEEDMSFIAECGMLQKQAGAHVIDVNVGVPGIDEVAFLPKAVATVQQSIDTPLMIDSSNWQAMEKAVRHYNGKAFLNSVNGKEDSLNSVLPIAAKYGGVLVGLLMDENGIPSTVEGRMAIAEKIIETAKDYGIKKKDIFMDALTMTVSADPNAAITTLETVKQLKDKLGVGTVLGVSNVSFGLPNREEITRTFYGLALDKGLDCAIMNPFSKSMMSAYYTYRALKGLDPNCMDYIGFAGQTKEREPLNTPAIQEDQSPKSDTPNLAGYILDGLKDKAGQATVTLLETLPPMEVINDHIIPGLAMVGDDFEKGISFLPQLLMSADAAGVAFQVIKDRMTTDRPPSKGKILLATVKGDIHDIGKNIVKVLLENYGYKVYDLGRDVDPSLIVETAVSEDIKLVGLSALMTTTVPFMKETIQLLRESGHQCKVVTGGAVLTEEYAQSIGSDFYAKDAMATVRFAEDLFQQ